VPQTSFHQLDQSLDAVLVARSSGCKNVGSARMFDVVISLTGRYGRTNTMSVITCLHQLSITLGVK
jgi:hypothetical protein